jgi:hypothetical protein
MPSLPEFDAKAERKFRIGYTHGVESVLHAVTHLLSDTQLKKLRKWSTNELLEWRTRSDDGFEEAPPPPALSAANPETGSF